MISILGKVIMLTLTDVEKWQALGEAATLNCIQVSD
jgi:hypothetical protein